MTPLPLPGAVILWSPELDLQIVLRHRSPVQTTKERAGGFRPIPVPQLRPITTWDGHPEIELTVAGVLDRYLDGGNVVDELEDLRTLGAKVSTKVRRPPIVRLIGRVPNPTSGTPEYVVNGLEIIEEQFNGGLVARALCTVTLLQWTPADITLRVEESPATSYRWKKGDTLSAVAKRLLGDARREREIRKANPKITKFTGLTAGTTVKVPPR